MLTKDTKMPQDGLIKDRFGRIFDYLRISVIENCNLRCVYCMPEQGVEFTPAAKLLTAGEMERLVRILSGHGVTKIRYTGGEPLLRKDIVEIVRKTTAIKEVRSVHITTNGIFLKDKLHSFREAGLHGINLSLDTLKPDRFEKIARRPGMKTVLDNLFHTLELGFDSVKLNVVLMRNFNDDEIPAFCDLTRDHEITVRFIELMPFDAHQIWKTGHFFGVELMQKELDRIYPELKEAEGSSTEEHVFRVPGHKGKIALIPSYTRSLCRDCSRIRLTADGKIRNCLYAEDEFDVLALLRNHASDDDIVRFFRNAMWKKLSDGWEAQKKPKSSQRSSMTQIGG
jgi:cyclic pyranopterin phosphate synthase